MSIVMLRSAASRSMAYDSPTSRRRGVYPDKGRAPPQCDGTFWGFGLEAKLFRKPGKNK